MYRGESRGTQKRCQRGQGMKGRRPRRMAMVQAHGLGVKEKETKLRDCLKDVSLVLGVKTKVLHLNLGMAIGLGSPY